MNLIHWIIDKIELLDESKARKNEETSKSYILRKGRLRHKKNKGVRQSHASSRNSKAIDVWKVTCHPPNRRVDACDEYSFKNTILFILLQWDVQTIIKLKSKRDETKKIRERLAKMFFSFIVRFHKVRDDLKRL